MVPEAPPSDEADFPIAEFLARPLMAHLATASSEGPRESPLWFLWEDQAIWLAGTTRDSFPRRIAADGRCALGVVDFDVHGGVLQHVGMRGVAEVVPLDLERLYRLLRRYLGEDRSNWNEEFQRSVIDHLDLMVRFVPSSTVVRDQSYFAAAFRPRRS